MSNSWTINLLESDTFLEFAARPALLRERYARLEARPDWVVIDEVQKLPLLLDEVHWLIENAGARFLLTGSSARKLRRGQANLLGGRAWRREMRPFCLAEFYLFVGLANFLCRRKPRHGTPEFGKSLEHIMWMEIQAWKAYRQRDLELSYWRTTSGFEVDFLFNDREVAIEVKSGRVHETDLKGLPPWRKRVRWRSDWW